MRDNAQDFDNNQAEAEGWGIWECDGSESGPYQLQRIDSPDDRDAPSFGDDAAAWEFVKAKAAEGSAYHVAALDYLKQHNPLEYAAIHNDAPGYALARLEFEAECALLEDCGKPSESDVAQMVRKARRQAEKHFKVKLTATRNTEGNWHFAIA